MLNGGHEARPAGRVLAAEVKVAVINHLRILLRSPEVIIGTWLAARPDIAGVTEAEVRAPLQDLDPLRDDLFPAEQARIVQFLVERVDIGTDRLAIRLRTAGPAQVAADLRAVPALSEAA